MPHLYSGPENRVHRVDIGCGAKEVMNVELSPLGLALRKQVINVIRYDLRSWERAWSSV